MDELNMNTPEEELGLDDLTDETEEVADLESLSEEVEAVEEVEAEEEEEEKHETTLNQSPEFLRKFAQNFSKAFVISPESEELKGFNFKQEKRNQDAKKAQELLKK